ncbi:meiosis regulator and mRNA stability factor 1-like isoform X2 [Daphnia carinata]|uniref:meiosis regulator and mRNA stability factor 1-like isoform X2 n=1 Tax=Daphnia carinata TaxID=120202 RepID=UPI0028695A39|nr:meiosis regulator and mRNA stability factor 1-like isoform X2 [Daphnia carinata]
MSVVSSHNERKPVSSCTLCGSYPKIPLFTPIGIFWDIENVRIPSCHQAIAVVEAIRQRFLMNYREAEFVVVCDVLKERKEVVIDLNNAQVTVVHVSCTNKNAADDKLRQLMRRFADNIGIPCAMLLISSDVNFTTDLSDFKNRKNVYVILLHQFLASKALLICANEHYLFDDIIGNVPFLKDATTEYTDPEYLDVINLPLFVSPSQVRQRVEQIAENCGGKMVQLQRGRGVIRFNSLNTAQRAVLRMQGEDVFGKKISIDYRRSPYQSTAVPRTPNDLNVVRPHTKEMIGGTCKRHFTPFPPPPNPAKVAPPRLLNLRPRSVNREEKEVLLGYEERCTKTAEQAVVDDTFRRAVLDADGPNRWDYYRTPSEYLVEKTPQGHRRIRAQHQSALNAKIQDNHVDSKTENRAAYIPFPAPSGETPIQTCFAAPAQSSFSALQSPTCALSTVSPVAVDLHVTNLDQSIGAKEMKTLITSVFKQHVMVMNVTVHLQSDGHLAAIVRVPSVQDAQYCVSQLHRRKLGSKRIMIAYDQNSYGSGPGRSVPTPLQIRAQVNALLAEIPQRRLPLFKFRELYEQRYTTSVSLADLHRLRDILHVTDDVHGRCVVFLQNQHPLKSQQSSGDESNKDVTLLTRSNSSGSEPELSVSEMPRCPLHDPIPNHVSHGWAELEPSPELPLVLSTLHQISLHTHCLLQSHGGTIPLASLARCYEMEIGELNVSEEKGVPLEHLISCVKGVGIVAVAGHKRLQWSGKNDQMSNNEPLQSLNPSLLPQMSLLCRELVDLLKMAPQSRIPFSKFIPAYHHHFGRQCRVADYGYTRLIDLLESLSHVVQILGEGSRRHVTLSHKAQMKRFTSDLLRNLKAQASKQMSVSIFPALYEKTLGRPFDPRDYGLCHLSDLLTQVAEASVVVMTTADGEEIIALPKREQTSDEVERTKQFALEVVELLKHAPQCKLDFAKFIPAYHHHFGRQCRVSDYGCQKLVELFESIPETVQVFELDNEIEKYVQLTMKQRMKILSDQVTWLVRNHTGHQPLLLNYLPDAFRIHYGFALKPEQYDARSLDELVTKLRNHVQVVYSERGAELALIDQTALSQAKFRVVSILYPVLDGSMALRTLLEKYKNNYGQECPLNFLTDYMEDIVIVDNESDSEPIVRFVPLFMFSRQVHILLNENGGRLLLTNFETSYLERFGVQCRPSYYGHSSIISLLQSILHLVVIRGKGPKRVITLHKEMAGLIPPIVPPAPKPSGIKPPAHWLIQPPANKPVNQEDISPYDKSGMCEDLKQFFNSSSASPVMLSPIPTFIPSASWSPVWSMAMGIPLNMSPTYASHAGYPPNWNATALASNYPCNYWFTAWHAPCTFPVPVTPVSNFTSPGALVKEIEDATSAPGIPPPASLLPRPSMILTSSVEGMASKSPVRSRIAAQFRTPAIKPLN